MRSISEPEEKPHIPILLTCVHRGSSEGTGSSCNTDVWANVGRLLEAVSKSSDLVLCEVASLELWAQGWLNSLGSDLSLSKRVQL